MKSLQILHADMDAFFSSVEQRENPELKGKPVIVGGVSRRGVVATASYEARQFGVHSAMPVAQARKLCPQGIYLPSRHQLYQQVSGEIFSILDKYTPLVEKLSIDEAFLDIKGCERLYGNPVKIAKLIKADVKQQTELTISIGLSINKFLAKLASDYDKPDGLTIVSANRVKSFLADLDIKKIWGVGNAFAAQLAQLNIFKVRDVWPYSQEELRNRFGKAGSKLFLLCRGIDQREVSPGSEIKSVSHEETFAENLLDKDKLLAYLFKMSEKVSFRLHSNSLKGKTVFIKIRYADFSTLNRQISPTDPVASAEKIYYLAKELLESNELFSHPVRLLGVGVANLTAQKQQQLNLFTKPDQNNKLDETIDELKRKYGFEKISRARKLYLDQ